MSLLLGSLFCSTGLCVCSCARTRLFDYHGLVMVITGVVIFPTLFFFLKIAAAIQDHLWLHINFRNVCSVSLKYAIGVLIGIVLNV